MQTTSNTNRADMIQDVSFAEALPVETVEAG